MYFKFEEFADLFLEDLRCLSWPCYFFVLNRRLLDKMITSNEIFDKVEWILDLMENTYLANHQFMMFRNEPSICDMYMFNEFMQLNIVGYDLTDRPRVMRYINRIANIFPEYKEICDLVFKIMKRRNIKLYVESFKVSL